MEILNISVDLETKGQAFKTSFKCELKEPMNSILTTEQHEEIKEHMCEVIDIMNKAIIEDLKKDLPGLEEIVEESIKEEIEKELSQYDNIEDKMLHILKELEETIRKNK